MKRNATAEETLDGLVTFGNLYCRCYEIVVLPLNDDAIAILPSGEPDEEYPPNKISDYVTSGARSGYPYSAMLIQG